MKIINLPDKMEYDINNLETYLQYKADCWRNVSISFKDAIENISPESIQNAIDMFEEVRTMFPFSEI